MDNTFVSMTVLPSQQQGSTMATMGEVNIKGLYVLYSMGA